MLITANNISSATISQIKAEPSDIITPLPDPAKDTSNTTSEKESVTISKKANSLQQEFARDKASVENNYTNKKQALEREYLQEKDALEREFNQKKRSLGISIYA